jgi:hypothetical protein
MVLVFLAEIFWVLKDGFSGERSASKSITDIATALFHRYGFYVEVISFVLLAGFVTAIYIGGGFKRPSTRQNLAIHDRDFNDVEGFLKQPHQGSQGGRGMKP